MPNKKNVTYLPDLTLTSPDAGHYSARVLSARDRSGRFARRLPHPLAAGGGGGDDGDDGVSRRLGQLEGKVEELSKATGRVDSKIGTNTNWLMGFAVIAAGAAVGLFFTLGGEIDKAAVRAEKQIAAAVFTMTEKIDHAFTRAELEIERSSSEIMQHVDLKFAQYSLGSERRNSDRSE